MGVAMTDMRNQRAVGGGNGAWIPWAFAGGMAMVVAVNVGLVWLALDSSPGLVVERAYERGRAYNQVLARARAQAELGWQVMLEFDTRVGEVSATFLDRAGQPIADLEVTVNAERPLEPLLPMATTLSYVGAGRYAGTLELPQRGQWELRLVARGAAEYQLARRVVVP